MCQLQYVLKHVFRLKSDKKERETAVKAVTAMVFTRQMTIGGSGGSSSSDESTYAPGPSKYTRNSIQTVNTSGNVRFVAVRTTKLLDLPGEIIEKILSYLSYKNICQLRLVSRTFDAICGHILNATFSRLQTQMLHRFQQIKSKMPRRESARRTHHLACESDIIETLHMRLTLLQMSFGKHIERKHCCFFPGEILDEVYHILHYIRMTPKLHRPYKVTDELFDLSTMAMEYFKEKIEPDLPEIAYFGSEYFSFSHSFPSSSSHAVDSGLESTQTKDLPSSHDEMDVEVEKPQSNMVLRKRIHIIKQGMKKYNNQLSILRQDLRVCKRKTSEQQNQIAEQQKLLTEQQQQTLEYAARLDEYDKKNEEISRKFSTLLQELNKCKTELQYWRSKSPAIPPFCTGCGNIIIPPVDDLQALVNQGINPEGLGLEPLSNMSSNTNDMPDISLDEIAEDALEENKPLHDEIDVIGDVTSVNISLQNNANLVSNHLKTKRIKEEISEHLQIKRRFEDETETVGSSKVTKKSRRLSKVRVKKF